MADGHAGVLVMAPDAADDDIVRRQIEPAQTSVSALNKRIQLIPESQIQRQFSRNLPAIPPVPAKLPFSTGQVDVLQRFSSRLFESQQKCGIRIELIRRFASI